MMHIPFWISTGCTMACVALWQWSKGCIVDAAPVGAIMMLASGLFAVVAVFFLGMSIGMSWS